MDTLLGDDAELLVRYAVKYTGKYTEMSEFL